MNSRRKCNQTIFHSSYMFHLHYLLTKYYLETKYLFDLHVHPVLLVLVLVLVLMAYQCAREWLESESPSLESTPVQ
jgi:hypothetical protein